MVMTSRKENFINEKKKRKNIYTNIEIEILEIEKSWIF